GSVPRAEMSGEFDSVVGTLGRALGSYGAYVCAGAKLVEYLVNSARPFIFSTAAPPPTVAAAAGARERVEAGPQHIARLRGNAHALRDALLAEGLSPGASTTQVIPV